MLHPLVERVSAVGSQAVARVRRYRRVRFAYLALRTTMALSPRGRFLADVLCGRAIGTYRSRRTGLVVSLRPRFDLQVAREQLSMDGYQFPAQVRAAVGLCGPSRILDLGANIGLFTLNASARHRDASIVAVEPDPENAQLLRRNVTQNGLDSRVAIVEAIGGTAKGSAQFAVGNRELSHVTDDSDGVVLPVVDVFELARGCDHIKMDIEGGEWPILRDPRLADLDARTIVMEWHLRNAHVQQPRDEAERLLRSAGYEVVHCGREQFWAGELWAYRAQAPTNRS